ncbi:hypothetical protein STEG23_001924, partial [Scotinomys teguina]
VVWSSHLKPTSAPTHASVQMNSKDTMAVTHSPKSKHDNLQRGVIVGAKSTPELGIAIDTAYRRDVEGDIRSHQLTTENRSKDRFS